ncbi:MAG: hypothetical protein HY239_19590, partial [Mycolicibacterium aromaticivorans]|nr:hypothetical protein [Mycolicibacterium aromaticivorans]
AEQLSDALAAVRSFEARGGALVIATAIWGPDPSFRSDRFAEVLVLSPGFIAGEQAGQLGH